MMNTTMIMVKVRVVRLRLRGIAAVEEPPPLVGMCTYLCVLLNRKYIYLFSKILRLKNKSFMLWNIIIYIIIMIIIIIYIIMTLSQVTTSRPPPHPQFWSHSYERCAMYWNESKINFPTFIFRVIVKIHRKLWTYEYKITISRKIKSEIWFFFRFSRFRIFHVNLTTFEKNIFWCCIPIHAKHCSLASSRMPLGVDTNQFRPGSTNPKKNLRPWILFVEGRGF